MEYRLPQLVDVANLQTLTDLWYKATGISSVILDPDGSILTKSGSQDICLNFCRLSPEPRERCVRSDKGIAIKVSRNYKVEKCRNGLSDASIPITVRGEHFGNFVTGPFFLEPPDIEFFKRQAIQFGLDENRYLDTVSKIPVVEKAKIHFLLQCSSVLTGTLFEAGIRSLPPETDGTKRAEEGLYSAPRALKESIASNMKELILPYLKKLKESGLTAAQMSTVDIIESNLKEITSPAIPKMQTLGLTPREIAVASLLRDGRTTKEIAELQGVSLRAVEFHRYNIRKKLGLDHKKTDLRTYLQSIN
jgi:DNA-binding CsgD family transcriptional regulator/ligand-binding sensor protein